MLDLIKMRLAQVADMARANGWKSVLKEAVFVGRRAIVVEKDLREVVDRPELLANAKLDVVEIDRKMASGAYEFALQSRRLKAIRNLDRGYGGHALVRGRVVVGDTWYWTSDSTDNPALLHIDLLHFGFRRWLKDEVYTFDIFVVPAERKGGIAPAFQNRAMLALRAKGYNKGYGFYWADNIPAHWCTRVTNKWKKLRTVSMSRFLMFTRAVPLKEEPVLHTAATQAGGETSSETKGESDHGQTADESAGRLQLRV